MEYCPQNAGVCITNRLFLLSSYAKSNSKPPAPYFAESIIKINQRLDNYLINLYIWKKGS